MQRRCQLFAGPEVKALKHLLDAAVEPLDHPVGLERFWRGQAVLNSELSAELVERVRAGRRALAQAEPAVSELLAVVCENRADAH